VLRPATLAVTFAIFAAACGRGGAGAGEGSAITGTVVSAPGCPAAEELAQPNASDSPSACEERPVAATVRIVDTASGEVAGQTVADENGRFRLELAPGDYEAQVLAEDGTEAGPAVVVEVHTGTATEVTLVYDTGIR
jgi:hypothetical protein